MDKEFADAINEFFKEYPHGKLPSGTIEILSGGYDNVGSSNIAFKKTMELLVFVFQHIDDLSDNELQCELLKLMWIQYYLKVKSFSRLIISWIPVGSG